jgi:predicted DNA-binding transcriptional regulator YafY
MQCEGLPSLTRWVLGFGGDAVPLAPKELVENVKYRADKILQAISDDQRKNKGQVVP